MRKIARAAVLFLLLLSVPAVAAVNVDVKISVPLPRIELKAPPILVVVPGTYVYAAPDVQADLIFYQNFWWRPYGGAWYRSDDYNGAWTAMPAQSVPVPVRNLPPNWKQVPPGHERMPYGQVKQNWPVWERERHWDKRGERRSGGGRAVGVAVEGRPAPAPGSGGRYEDRPSGSSPERDHDDHDKKHKKDKKDKKGKKDKHHNGDNEERRDDRRGDKHHDRDEDRGEEHGHRR